MKLELFEEDLRPECADVHLQLISYKHFKPEVQAVLRLTGRGVFFRYGKTSYHAVNLPEELRGKANNHDALVAALEGLLEIAQAAIVTAHGRNEYPAIIANLEMKESAARAALVAAKGEADANN